MRIVTRHKVPLGCLVLAVQVRSALKQCDDGAEFVLHNFGSSKHLVSVSPTSTGQFYLGVCHKYNKCLFRRLRSGQLKDSYNMHVHENGAQSKM
jgi:hypothetical protein